MKKNRIIFYYLLSFLILIITIGCSSQPQEPSLDDLRTFTLEELSEFNGKNGINAYIAVDGIVYDVTDVAEWQKGSHNGFEAGNDLTDEIKNISPHGVSKLRNLKKVGKLTY